MSTATPSSSAGQSVSVATTQQATPLPAVIQQDLRELFSKVTSDSQSLDKILSLTSKYTGSAFVAYFQLEEKQLTPIAMFGEFKPPANTFGLEQVEQICRASAARGHVTTRCLSSEHKLFLIAVPMAANERTPTVLAALVQPGPGGIASQIATMERMGAAIVQWRLTDALTRLDWEAHTSSAATELVSRIESSESVLDATYQLVNELCNFLECKQVALSFPRKTGVGCQVHAISGMAEFDHNSATVEHLRAAMDECLIRDDLTLWPPLHGSDRHATLAHRKLTEQVKEQAACSIPLNTIHDEHVGVLTITGNRYALHHSRVQSALRAFAPHLATAIKIRQNAQPGLLERSRQWLAGDKDSPRRKWAIVAMIATACFIPLVPWQHRVKSDCQLEPVVRRFMVAPFEGRLETSLVKPGDIVSQGQALAEMDDRELGLELESTKAEYKRAGTKRAQATTEHNTSEAKLAELEMRKYYLKLKMLHNRTDQLKIVSPIHGVVLRGDLDDAEGAPVDSGQTLFEIAPLNPIKIEIAVSEEDLPSVTMGMDVTARLDGYHGPMIAGANHEDSSTIGNTRLEERVHCGSRTRQFGRTLASRYEWQSSHRRRIQTIGLDLVPQGVAQGTNVPWRLIIVPANV